MREAILISAVSHLVLVALVLLGTPKLFEDVAPRSIEAELVRAEDVPLPPPAQPPPAQQPEKPAQPEAVIPPAKLSPDDAVPRQAEPPQQAKAPAQSEQPPAPKQKSAGAQAKVAAPAPAPQPPQPPQQAAQPTPSIFDPANIPALLDLPNAPSFGFDSTATTVAALSENEKGAFRAHLRKCWKLPGSMSPTQTTRVVMRVYLAPDGALASEPILVEASASRDGPALVKTAISALKDCQPYGFLPADKYREWKALDLSFSPRDMAGG